MLQKREDQKSAEIKFPQHDARIKLTPEELESLNAASDKSCLCHDAATSSWENPCVPSA